MGKISHFFVILLTVCSLSIVSSKPAEAGFWGDVWDGITSGVEKAYNATVGAAVEAVQNTCFDDCDANNWGSDLIKLYRGGSEGQAVFAQIFDNSQYAKCETCRDNNCNIANNFNQDNCLTACTNGGNVGNCESHCNNVRQTTERECKEASDANSCASAQVKSFVGNLVGATLIIGGIAATVAATVLTGGLASGIAAAAIKVGVGVASATVGAVGAGIMVRSSTSTPNFNQILAGFVNWGDRGCWFCSVFTTVFNTVNELASKMYVELRDIFFTLLIIIAMAWLLWEVLKFMTTIHGPNIGEFVTKLFKGLGTVMLIAIILKAPPSFIAGYVIDIPVGIASGLASDIMKMNGINETVQVPYTYTLPNGCEVSSTREESLCSHSDPNSAEFKDKMLSTFMYDNMLCLLKKMSLNLITGMAVGTTIIQYAFFAGNILPDFYVLLAGIIVLLGYFWLYIMVPFKLIDILLRMGFAVIMLPVFVTCMATKQTRKYTEKGWQMFLGCWITLICLCVFLVLALQIVASAFM